MTHNNNSKNLPSDETNKIDTMIANADSVMQLRQKFMPDISPELNAIAKVVLDTANKESTDAAGMAQLLAAFRAYHQEIEVRQSQKAFDNAFTAAMSEMPDVFHKDKELQLTKSGSKGKYLSASGALKVIKPILSRYGLSMTFSTDSKDDRVIATVIISGYGHEKINQISMPKLEILPNGSSFVQNVGAVRTYCVRYAIYDAIGICPDDEDIDSTPQLIGVECYVLPEDVEEFKEACEDHELVIKWDGKKKTWFYGVPKERKEEVARYMRKFIKPKTSKSPPPTAPIKDSGVTVKDTKTKKKPAERTAPKPKAIVGYPSIKADVIRFFKEMDIEPLADKKARVEKLTGWEIHIEDFIVALQRLMEEERLGLNIDDVMSITDKQLADTFLTITVKKSKKVIKQQVSKDKTPEINAQEEEEWKVADGILNNIIVKVVSEIMAGEDEDTITDGIGAFKEWLVENRYARKILSLPPAVRKDELTIKCNAWKEKNV